MPAGQLHQRGGQTHSVRLMPHGGSGELFDFFAMRRGLLLARCTLCRRLRVETLRLRP